MKILEESIRHGICIPGQTAGAAPGNPQLRLRPKRWCNKENYIIAISSDAPASLCSHVFQIHLFYDVTINKVVEREQRLRPLLVRVPGAHFHGNGPTPGHRAQVLDASREEER